MVTTPYYQENLQYLLFNNHGIAKPDSLPHPCSKRPFHLPSTRQHKDYVMFSRLAARQNKQITESEVNELNDTVQKLRKSLDHIVDEELSNDLITCCGTGNELARLRLDIDEKRREREACLAVLERAREELAELETKLEREREEFQPCQDEARRLRTSVDMAKVEISKLREETDELKRTNEAETEKMHKLRADVQNIEIEREKDAIDLRHRKLELDEARKELEKLKAERDSLLKNAESAKREFQEAVMDHEMQTARREALTMHLESMGGSSANVLSDIFHKPDSIKASFAGFFSGRRVSSEHKSNNNSQLHTTTTVPTKLPDETVKTGAPIKRDKSDPSFSKQIGGVFFGSEQEDSPFYHRQLPKIFKMGNEEECGNRGYGEQEKEVQFYSDAASCVSALTLNEDEWTESCGGNS